jgi:hypothetical protein
MGMGDGSCGGRALKALGVDVVVDVVVDAVGYSV